MTVEPPAPIRPSPEICAAPPSRPEPAPGAGWIDPAALPPPQRDAALAAESWVSELAAWGARGWAIIETERKRRCDGSEPAEKRAFFETFDG